MVTAGSKNCRVGLACTVSPPGCGGDSEGRMKVQAEAVRGSAGWVGVLNLCG